MNDKILWILGPAVFSLIGMTAGYLNGGDHAMLATGVGCVVGFFVTSIAMAGEKPQA